MTLAGHRFVRFLAVGAVNTLFSYGVYAAFLYVGLSYVVANFLALLAGILFSFRTQGAFVFYNRDWRLFGRFVVCWGFIYIVNILLIGVMMRSGLDAYVSGALALPPIAVLSYFVQRLFVFRIDQSRA